MKAFHVTLATAAAFTLGACSISVTDDGVSRYNNRDYGQDRVTVTLPNGDRDGFSCPEGTSSFVINKKDEGLGMAYGCRTNGSPEVEFDGGL